MKSFVSIAIAAALAACAPLPPGPPDASVVRFVGASGVQGFERYCPAVGNPRFETGLPVPQQVERAFDEAIARAGLRATAGRITGRLTRAEVAARGMSVGTSWDVAVLLAAPGNRNLGVELRHAFEPGLGQVAACNDAGDAFTLAIRELADKAVADPRFAAMLQ